MKNSAKKISLSEPVWLAKHPHVAVLRVLSDRGYFVDEIAQTDIVMVSKPKLSPRWLFLQGYTPLVPYSLGLILSNKTFVKAILKTGRVPVPNGKTFMTTEKVAATQYAQRLGWPLFLRQENSQLAIAGAGPITDSTQLETVWQKLLSYGESVLVEKYVTGRQLLVYIDQDDFIQILGTEESVGFQPISNRLVTQKIGQTHFTQDVTVEFITHLLPLAKKIVKIFAPLPALSFSVRYDVSRSQSVVVTEVFHSLSRHYGYMAQSKANLHMLVEQRVADLIEVMQKNAK